MIPEGYSAAVAAGERADLTLASHPGLERRLHGRQRGPDPARGTGHRGARVPGRRRGDLVDAKHAGRDPGRGIADAAARARPIVAQALAGPAAGTDVVEAGAAAGQIPSGFVLSSPGMVVNFILFSLLTAGIAPIVERQTGTLQRLMTTRLRRWQSVARRPGCSC